MHMYMDHISVFKFILILIMISYMNNHSVMFIDFLGKKNVYKNNTINLKFSVIKNLSC